MNEHSAKNGPQTFSSITKVSKLKINFIWYFRWLGVVLNWEEKEIKKEVGEIMI